MCNQGKKGEMKTTELISKMGQYDNRVDFVRFTRTNTPDNGHDIGLFHTENHFDEMIKISDGELSEFSDYRNDNSEEIQTRIDVKNENTKVTKPVAEKFVGDIKKHPDCNGHLLIGNNGLTKGAEQVLNQAHQSYPNKKIGYISNDGVSRLMEVNDRKLAKQRDIKKEILPEVKRDDEQP